MPSNKSSNTVEFYTSTYSFKKPPRQSGGQQLPALKMESQADVRDRLNISFVNEFWTRMNGIVFKNGKSVLPEALWEPEFDKLYQQMKAEGKQLLKPVTNEEPK